MQNKESDGASPAVSFVTPKVMVSSSEQAPRYSPFCNKIWLIGLLNALGTYGYIIVVAYIMSHGEKWFGKMDSIMVGVAMLTLLVFSATFVSGFILGRSILLYMDNKKKEAVKLFHITIVWLAFLAILSFGYLALK